MTPKVTKFILSFVLGGEKITFRYRYRKQIIIGLIALVVIIISIALVILYYPKEEKKSTNSLSSIIKDSSSKKDPSNKENTSEESVMYKVDIKGQVITPGIYTMKDSSRVIDVIEAAGGLTENANTTVLNLSKKITDEMVIIVYSNEEVTDFAKTKEIEQQVQEQCQQKDENSLKNDACICDTTISTNTMVSINTATLEELMTLPGIGESKAKDIINYRTTNGPFKSIEDLKNISGIGESLFAKIKENITI